MLLLVGLTVTSELRKERIWKQSSAILLASQTGNDRAQRPTALLWTCQRNVRSLIIPIMLTAAHGIQNLQFSYKSSGLPEIQFEFRIAAYI